MSKKYIFSVLLLLLNSWMPLFAVNSKADNLIITEISTGSIDSASAEFIEIYNPSSEAVALRNVEIEYKSATGDTWQTKVDFEDKETLDSQDFLLLATEEASLENAEVMFNSGLALESGHIRISQWMPLVEEESENEHESTDEQETSQPGINKTETKDASTKKLEDSTESVDEEGEESDVDDQEVESQLFIHDTVGWGEDADSPESNAAEYAGAEQSLKRIVNEDAQFIDSGDNSLDFEISDNPHPQAELTIEESDQTGEEPAEDEAEVDGDQQDSDSNNKEQTGNDDSERDNKKEQEEKTYQKVLVNEILPDPTSPLTDAEDEFIELHNPNTEPVDLSGYTVQAGSNLQYTYELDGITIQPDSYVALSAAETGLVFANNGSRSHVIDPNGESASNMVRYEDAPEGESWSYIKDGFEWTDRTTAGEPNLASLPEPKTKKPSMDLAKDNTNQSTDKARRTYPDLLLSEVFPDPDSPQTDSDDEFVEIYNPNKSIVDLSGFVIRSGSRGTTTHTIKDISIEPQSYVAFFSSDSSLTLSNSGIEVFLEDPNGETSDSVSYPEAETGSSWSMFSDKWAWTVRPTPAAKNVKEQKPASKEQSDQNETNNKDGPSGLAKPGVLSATSQPATIDVKHADYRLIAGAGVLALLYGLYEFRYDAQARFHQFRRYIAHRRSNR